MVPTPGDAGFSMKKQLPLLVKEIEAYVRENAGDVVQEGRWRIGMVKDLTRLHFKAMDRIERTQRYVERCLVPVFQLQPSDRVFQGYSLAFDSGFGEVYMAFSSGATLVCGSSEMMRSGADLKYTIRDLKITVLDTTPTNLLIMGDGSDLPALHTVIVGGEQCSTLAVDRWQPGRRPNESRCLGTGGT